MWTDDKDPDDDSGEADEFESLRRSFDTLFDQTFTEFSNMLYDLDSRSLKPLFKIELDDETVTVTFDLPGVRKDDVAISCTEDVLSIEAKMLKPFKLRVSNTQQSHVEFERYSKKLRLPVRVDPNKGTAKFRGGMVLVRLPILREGKAVKIGPESWRSD